MSSTTSEPTRDRWPKGVLGMLVLVAIIEGYINGRTVELTETSHSGWSIAAREALSTEVRASKLLCFGDSLVKHGVLPSVVESRSGSRTYNLSVPAAPAPVAYFVLRKTLVSGAKPDAVLVDFKPDLLAGGIRFSTTFWPHLLDLRDCLHLASVAHDSQFVATTMLARALPSLRMRDEIRRRIHAELEGSVDPTKETNLALWRNWAVNKGAQFTPRKPGYSGVVSAEDHKRYMTNAWWCHRVNRFYITAFMDVAEAKSIRVYWLLPPIAPVLQAEREKAGTDQKHTEFVKGFVARYKNLYILDARRSEYPHTVFVDPVHLDGLGAYSLSDAIGHAMDSSSKGGADRWIVLPRFRQPDHAPTLEDVEQSKIATGGKADAIRKR